MISVEKVKMNVIARKIVNQNLKSAVLVLTMSVQMIMYVIFMDVEKRQQVFVFPKKMHARNAGARIMVRNAGILYVDVME
jgi:hypothetical protein